MDNDNKLVQKAADLYRSLRFSMKYRGLTILSAEAGNDAIAAAIAAGAPYMAARCGATEMRTAADYLQNGGVGFAEKTREDIRNLSGVFPTDDAVLAKFCRTCTLIVPTPPTCWPCGMWGLSVRSSVAAQKPPAMPNCARWSPTTTPTRGAPHWPASVCWWCTPLKQR